jgi:hypothetical protein
MKQILITISMLAIALALVIGVIVPIFKHGAKTGDTAVLKAEATITRIGQVLK